MELGNKIRELRLKKSVTQEQLAKRMGVSAQCVSKWENNVTMPDILLLPELSAYFGVTIDELFDLTEDTRLERISSLLENERMLDEAEFCRAESFLLEKARARPQEPKYKTLLAELYNHMADGYRAKAEESAKQALRLEPDNKENHSQLRMAQNGFAIDWNFSNCAERIAFYQKFCREHPRNRCGCMDLLEGLIADYRLEEAKALLARSKELLGDVRASTYEGWIQWKSGDQQGALQCWREMTKRHPDDWLAAISEADCLAHVGRYDPALELYRRALALQPKPRYTDSAICIAQICEIQGDYPQAIEAWNEVIRILEEEYDVREGESVDAPRREIERLAARCRSEKNELVEK